MLTIDDKNVSRQYMSQLLESLLINYQNTTEERHSISIWEENKEYTILGVIELLTDTIRGYASQITTNGFIEKTDEALERLTTIRFLSIPYCVDWYFSAEHQHSELKAYVEQLDYLRLLILEYVRIYQ